MSQFLKAAFKGFNSRAEVTNTSIHRPGKCKQFVNARVVGCGIVAAHICEQLWYHNLRQST